MLGLAAAPEIATAVASEMPPWWVYTYSSVGTKPLNCTLLSMPAVRPTSKPENNGVNTKEAALRSW